MWMENLPNGKYKFVERYTDQKGKERRVSVTRTKKTKKIQEETYLLLQERIKEKLDQGEDKTLKQVIEEWKSIHFQTLKVNTIKCHQSRIKVLYDYFGENTGITVLTAPVINRLILYLLKDKGLKRGTVSAYLATMRLITRHAVTYGYLKEDPTRYIKIPMINLSDDNDWKFLEKDELEEVIHQLHKISPQSARLAEFLALTGLRFGEAVAIDYERQVDFENNTLLVDRTATRHGTFNTPKAGKSRTVHLSDRAVEVTKEQKTYTMKKSLRLGIRNTLLFTGERSGDALRLVSLNRNLKAVDVGKPLSSHIFRHTFITRMVEAQVPSKIIAEHVGHSDTSMIEKVYSHFTEEMDRQMKRAIQNVEII